MEGVEVWRRDGKTERERMSKKKERMCLRNRNER